MAEVRAFEDFVVGTRFDLGSKTVTADEIVEFAREFDPQPIHLDEDAGRESILGGLSASGWHSCSMFMRLFWDGLLQNSTCQGSPGVDFVKWRKPVLAGDTLKATTTVLATRLSKSRPSIGLVSLRAEMCNQRGEVVFELENTVMLRTRQDAAA